MSQHDPVTDDVSTHWNHCLFLGIDGLLRFWQGPCYSYRYTLTADDQGLVTGGSWSSSNQHPDFAWVPYYNPRYPSQNGSENGYLDFGHLADMLGPEALRQ